MELEKQIAKAIKKADNSYFFEDYSKQARAVLNMLEREGFQIVPKDLDKELYKKIADQMRIGKMPPEVHVEDVYHTMFRILKEEGKIR